MTILPMLCPRNRGPSVTHPGDQWLLGRNESVAATRSRKTPYAVLMQDGKAAMAFIDTPYNVAIEGNVSGLGSVHHHDFAMACGEMSVDQFTAFLARIFSLLARYSLDGAIHFICMDWRHMAEVLAAGGQVYDRVA